MAIDLSQILPEIYVGTGPTTRQDVERLKKEFSISAVLNLQTDADMLWHGTNWHTLENYYKSLSIEIVRLPIRDFDPIDLKQKIRQSAQELHRLVSNHPTVYVHCTAGLNRSPTVTIAYLYLYRGFSLENAISKMRDSRYCEPYPELID